MSLDRTRRDVLKGTIAGTVAFGLGAGSATAGQDSGLADDEDVRWRWGPDEGPDPPNPTSHASPSVVDGTVYTTVENAYDPGGAGTDDYVPFGLYALDAKTGDYQWHFRDPDLDTTNTSPNVVDGTVYVGASEYLFAVDARTGEQTWKTAIHIGEDTRLKTPTAWNGTVYVGGLDGLHAVDAETGDVTWTYRTPVLAGPEKGTQFENKPPNVPSVADGVVYFTVPRDHDSIVALDAETGEEVWSYDPRPHQDDGYGANRSILTVADGIVYAGTTRGSLNSDGGDPYMDPFVAIDAVTGAKLWGARFPDISYDTMWTGPTVADGTVYVTPYGIEGHVVVYALDAATGRDRWAFPIYEGGRVSSMPTVADGVVYFAIDGGSPEDSALLGVDAETGEETWRKPVYAGGGIPGSSPTVVDGVLYVGALDDPGGVYAFDLDSDGSSEDSRVALGTLGHHDAWAWQSEEPPEPAATPGGTETGSGGTETDVRERATTAARPTDTAVETPTNERTETPAEAADDPGRGSPGRDGTGGDRGSETATEASQPGMGVLEALAGLGSLGYVLARRLDDEGD